jgi:hypothetical protein
VIQHPLSAFYTNLFSSSLGCLYVPTHSIALIPFLHTSQWPVMYPFTDLTFRQHVSRLHVATNQPPAMPTCGSCARRAVECFYNSSDTTDIGPVSQKGASHDHIIKLSGMYSVDSSSLLYVSSRSRSNLSDWCEFQGHPSSLKDNKHSFPNRITLESLHHAASCPEKRDTGHAHTTKGIPFGADLSLIIERTALLGRDELFPIFEHPLDTVNSELDECGNVGSEG